MKKWPAKVDYARTTFQRTIFKFLSNKWPSKRFCMMQYGRLLIGSESAHRTRMGVKYNQLVQLHRRTHKE